MDTKQHTTDDARAATAVGDEAVREHASPVVRWLLLAAGTVFVALGLIGLFLPVLPTTPFMLLAAASYARASKRCYDWLLSNRTFGPMIHEWRKHRSIPYRTKIAAIGLMLVTLAISIVFFVQPGWLKAVLAAMGLALALWMYRLPSRDRVRR
ncbi:MAG: YbaN family protein [Burkholderiaceae bacterium]